MLEMRNVQGNMFGEKCPGKICLRGKCPGRNMFEGRNVHGEVRSRGEMTTGNMFEWKMSRGNIFEGRNIQGNMFEGRNVHEEYVRGKKCPGE